MSNNRHQDDIVSYNRLKKKHQGRNESVCDECVCIFTFESTYF